MLEIAERMRADVRRITGIDDPYLQYGDSRVEKMRRIEHTSNGLSQRTTAYSRRFF